MAREKKVVDTGVDVGVAVEGSLPRSNYAAHAGRASPHLCTVVLQRYLRAGWYTFGGIMRKG